MAQPLDIRLAMHTNNNGFAAFKIPPHRTILAAGALALAACLSPAQAAESGEREAAFITLEQGVNAYAMTVKLADADQADMVSGGRRKFNDFWSLRNEIEGVWGLGPTFNEVSCPACHANNGRSRAPEHGQEAQRGMVVRLSVAGEGEHGAPKGHPSYGDQLQNRSIASRVPREGKAVITYQAREVGFADGEKVALRAPKIEFGALQFGELGADVMTSARSAPALYGLGLLEAVPEEAILELARQQEQRGLRGKPNYVWDYEANKLALGRFGWKANQPSLRHQIAAAFLNDIGATSAVFKDENCPSVQSACASDPTTTNCGGQGGGCGGDMLPEVLPSRLNGVTLYLQAVMVPARRNADDAQVKRGEELFTRAHCSACHVPELRTGARTAIPQAADLTIRPYTDLLLHDMGEALADGRPDFAADGRQWRTPPLWGLGLMRRVNGHSDLLHDGRARDVVEAILWHGGEAQVAQEAFRGMPKAEREALVKFVESL